MKKKMKAVAIFMAVIMAMTTVVTFNAVPTAAEVQKSNIVSPFKGEGKKTAFTTPTGTVIGETQIDDIEIKGAVEEGQTTYELKTTLAVPHHITLKPLINYNQTDEEAYNEAIKNLKTTFSVKRNRKQVNLYQYSSQTGVFDEGGEEVSEIKLQNFTDVNDGENYRSFYYGNAVFPAGEYTFTYTLPEEVTKGARIYLATDGNALNDKDIALSKQNTKETAISLKTPRDIWEEPSIVGIFKKGSSNTFWYKFTLLGNRDVSVDVSCIQFLENPDFEMTVYKPDGTKQVCKTGSEDNGESNGCGYYRAFADWGYERATWPKGTYYIKIQVNTDIDGYFGMDVNISGPGKPAVTYWAQGKKMVKGVAEPGARAYAVVKGKTYKAAKKADANGKFSIKIPSVKAGTKIKVYFKDCNGTTSEAKTVTVKKVPNAPTATVYKKETKTIKGKTVTNGTVKVTYQGKTYKAKTGSKGAFTITTKTALKSGKTFKIRVTDVSGNVSKTKTYKVK